MLMEKAILDSKTLIVDDEPHNVLLLERALKQKGFSRLRSTTRPLEVCKIYEEFMPDLVLLDLKMPLMDGFQVMEELRKIEGRNNSYAPVLVLTAQNDHNTRLRALNAGARDFVGKPFDLSEMYCRARSILEVRLLHNKIKNQNEILEQTVCERTEELRKTQLEVIHRLAMAGEVRDNETGNHILRMSHYCACLGGAAGMTDEECGLLLHASPMHDVGKIAIPDRVLLKPGKLDCEEWEIMKTHSLLGAELLSGSEYELMRMARIIALHHHEKWDGSGYPSGLKGEAIPLEARIVALCDVFDALTSKRPYKEAWSVEKTMEEIEKSAGSHFDPQLVAIFKSILPKILEIKTAFCAE